LKIGDLQLGLLIKEITEIEEFASYEALTEFHYRGNSLHGRTARLIVRNYHPLYPQVIGYVELATPFYMNKCRSLVLDSEFSANGIKWDGWDMKTMKKYIHLIVRIARCVVYPEFRGSGLGQLLLKHAANFVRNRWQVSKLTPFFLEISADMLRFVPFAHKAGMVFVGETEGNLGRVAKDMQYLLKNRERVRAKDIVKEESCGIVDQQVNRMEKAAQIMEREGWDEDELVERLTTLSTAAVLRDFHLFHRVISLPKPTYMQGLFPEAQEFVSRRAAELGKRNGWQPATRVAEPVSTPVSMDKISLSYVSRVRRTTRTHAIQQAFSISPDDIEHHVIRDFSLTLEPGQIILVTGPSASGKTSLLRLLMREDEMTLTGTITWPVNYRPKRFSRITSNKALIEVLSDCDVKDALFLMGVVGLSDAFIYLKRFEELSAGQQYRAMLAQLIISQGNVWIADEFCTNLDPLTSNLVAHRLQKVARELGVILVVASPQPENFIAALRPDLVVKLTTSWEHNIISGEQFGQSMRKCRNAVTFAPREIRISEEQMTAVRAGHKTSIIQVGVHRLDHPLVMLKTTSDFEVIRLVSVQQKILRELVEDDIRREGVASLRKLKSLLKRQFPKLDNDSTFTVIAFERLNHHNDGFT
jgi:ABC-type ATPase with predicted acetyltransferase domain